MADALTTLLQTQNDRITALENATLDSVLILPLIEKVYVGIKVKASITVIRAKYVLCGTVTAAEDQLNTLEYEVKTY